MEKLTTLKDSDTPEITEFPALWRLGFLLALSWIVGLSLMPFEFSLPAAGWLARLNASLSVANESGLAVNVMHFASFCMLGFLGLKAHPPVPNGIGLRQLFLIFGAGCLALEFAKFWVPNRHPLVLDLGVKVFGMAAGMAVAARIQNGKWLASWLIGGFSGLALAAWWIVGLMPVFGAVRLNWNPDFRLLIGNEDDGSKPWMGKVRKLVLFDAALSPNETEMQKFQPLVTYQFPASEEGPVVPSGVLADDPALVMEKVPGGYLASHSAAASLTHAISRSGAFTVVVTLEIDRFDQTGPARIVSLSKDWSVRNFTLGQEGDEVVLRVANRVNRSNGHLFALQQKALRSGVAELVINYDQGVSSMFLNGVPLPERVDLREPWYYLPVSKCRAGRAAVLLWAVISIAIPVCFALRTRDTVGWFPALAAAWFLVALPFGVCSLTGGLWTARVFAGVALAMAVAVPVAAKYLGLAQSDNGPIQANNTPAQPRNERSR